MIIFSQLHHLGYCQRVFLLAALSPDRRLKLFCITVALAANLGQVFGQKFPGTHTRVIGPAYH